MAEALEIKKQVKENVMFLSLKGVITEDSKLSDLIPADTHLACVIDLGLVTRINSYGIRQWVNTLKQTKEKTSEIIFVKCPSVLIEQFNMISNFGAGGYVYSFYLPFFSEDEDREEQVILELKESRSPEDASKMIEEAQLKLTHPKSFVFNDIDDEYFSFLQFQKNRKLPESIIKLLLE